MNIHEGPTGKLIKLERNHKINGHKPHKRIREHRLHGCPNPLARSTAFWKYRHGLV